MSPPRAERRRWLAAALLGLALPAQGHEFWMLPHSFMVEPGASTALFLSVGESFLGERVGMAQTNVAAFARIAQGRRTDLLPALPRSQPVGEWRVELPQRGLHLFALDTRPNEIVLEAGKFHGYLRDEGLEAVIAQREASGRAAEPGRERYRRHIKSLLLAGPTSDAGWSARTGQRLELIPLNDPYRLAPGGELGLQVMFEGRPLAGALLKCWHRRADRTEIVMARTDAAGRASLRLPWAGVWMASVVHMVPVADSQHYDWDSFWGNLSFSLPAAPLQPL